MLIFYLQNQNTASENITPIWCKITSVNLELSNTRKVNFDNKGTHILKIRSLNITLLPKNIKNFKNYIFLIASNQCNVLVTTEKVLEERRIVPLK